jgi:hypothetical protein
MSSSGNWRIAVPPYEIHDIARRDKSVMCMIRPALPIIRKEGK